MSGIFASQGAAELTTAAVLVLSAGLSAAMSVRCLKRRNRPLLFWSAGLWLFTFGALLELMFAGNIYSSFAAKAYLLVAAVLVGTLALGSIQLSKSSRIRKGYYLFFILPQLFPAGPATYNLIFISFTYESFQDSIYFIGFVFVGSLAAQFAISRYDKKRFGRKYGDNPPKPVPAAGTAEK